MVIATPLGRVRIDTLLLRGVLSAIDSRRRRVAAELRTTDLVYSEPRKSRVVVVSLGTFMGRHGLIVIRQ